MKFLNFDETYLINIDSILFVEKKFEIISDNIKEYIEITTKDKNFRENWSNEKDFHERFIEIESIINNKDN